MSGWPPHEDDEFVDATSFGDTEPTLILARSGVATEISRTRERYVRGQINLDEFVARIDELLDQALDERDAAQ